MKRATVQFAAIGIVTNNSGRHRTGASRPGQIAYRFDDDFDEVTRRLSEAEGDYRILSIHYGYERLVRVDAMQKRDWRGKAVRERGIDLIVGHHAHVARPVEVNGKGLIFYGLGNFLHHGTADMSRFGLCRDYGVVARLHLGRGPGGALRARAIEALPVTNMHMQTRPFARVGQAHRRIHVLNHLAADLDAPGEGAAGVCFTPQRNGTGLYCFAGADKEPGRIGALCRGWQPAPAPTKALRARIARGCGPVRRAGKRRGQRRARTSGVSSYGN